MAKANNSSSTIDWIWLHDALVVAIKAFGSAVLAKARLTEWMASGQLPWSCMSFEGPNADDIARLQQEERDSIVGYILPSVAYHEGDPAFWRADLNIWWGEDKNGAREKSIFGARALGIKISREHLLGLLPEDPRERDEVHGAGAWIAAEVKKMKAANEIPPDIRITNFARELEGRMRKAAAGDKSLRPIQWRSIKNRLTDWGLWPVASIK
jgi:hypothetical protein